MKRILVIIGSRLQLIKARAVSRTMLEAGWIRLASPINDSKVAAAAMKDAIGNTGQPIRPYGVGNTAAVITQHPLTSGAAS